MCIRDSIYRQQVLADCLANRAAVQQMYNIASAVDGIELRRKVFLGGLNSRDPDLILRRSVRILELLTTTLRRLSNLSDEHAGRFSSTGFRQLFAMLTEQLSDHYLAQVDEYLGEFHLPRGVLLSAQLGDGNKGDRHVLHQPPRRSLWARLSGSRADNSAGAGRGFVIDDSDLAGAQALSKLCLLYTSRCV